MIDPRETKVQIALGTYPIYWVTFSHNTIHDPEDLTEMLDEHLPKWTLWSQGKYQVWATVSDLCNLQRALRKVHTIMKTSRHVVGSHELYPQRYSKFGTSKYLF